MSAAYAARRLLRTVRGLHRDSVLCSRVGGLVPVSARLSARSRCRSGDHAVGRHTGWFYGWTLRSSTAVSGVWAGWGVSVSQSSALWPSSLRARLGSVVRRDLSAPRWL